MSFLEDKLSSFNPRMLEHPQTRRALTEMDPALFAMLYLSHHLRSDATGGQITFSEFHIDLCGQALEWVKPLESMKAFRDIYVAPRDIGKSTWLYLVLPMWALAHEHLSFVAAFADSATQAESHLATFRHELDTNPVLRQDFPRLCRPKQMSRVARTLADNRGQIHQDNDAVFMAKGIDSSVLGMKVGNRRPQVIVMDDVEPGESNYSQYQATKRLQTIQDVILPLNSFARVLFVGTVTMNGSLVHQAVQSVISTEEPEPWLKEENFRVHYYPAILQNDDGTERSIWPEKWPLEELESIRHTRSFAKNFMNQPKAIDSVYWSDEDVEYGSLDSYIRTLLFIDPAVTTKSSSDFTGLVVVSYAQEKCYIRHAMRVKLVGSPLRDKVIEILEDIEDCSGIVIETNQGGDLWHDVLHNLPVRLKTISNSDPKQVRIEKALAHYQRHRVKHCKELPVLESEMTSYPNVVHDDTVDAMATGVNYFLEKKPKKKAKARQVSYAN